jgi:hypothetical protein
LYRKNSERVFEAYLIEELLAAPPAVGALSERRTYLHWISKIVFGAKMTFLRQLPSPNLVADYANLITACWRQLRDAPAGRPFGLIPQWAFAPINEMANTQDSPLLGDFWICMRPIACSVVRDRSWPEVHWFLLSLKGKNLGDRLGAEALMAVFEAVDAKYRHALESYQMTEGQSSSSHEHESALEQAAELAEYLGLLTSTTPNVRSRLHSILQTWDMIRARAAARKLRTQQ